MNALSGTLWPVHLKPQKDELLSSWIVRLARAHGLKLHTFCDLAWRKKNIWNRDIDKCADWTLTRVLSEKTATAVERVQNTLLSSYEGFLYEKHNPNGNTAWIMPIGVYHRTRRAFGMQFCPQCLKEDKEPYFRRKWRLAFVTCCERHGIALLDRCPVCQAPVAFHRVAANKPLSVCTGCGFNYKLIKNTTAVSEARRKDQGLLLRIVKNGWIKLPRHGCVYSHLYFVVLHQLMKLISSSERVFSAKNELVKITGIPLPKINTCRSIEMLEVEARYSILANAIFLLKKWPYNLLKFCNAQGIKSSVLLKDMPALPFWYSDTIKKYLYSPSYHPTDEEIASVIQHLRRLKITISAENIEWLVGCTDVFRKRSKKLSCFLDV